MKIFMVVYGYPPLPVGGAEKQCQLQARELVRKGHTCEIVTARTLNTLPLKQVEDGVKVHRVRVLQPSVTFLLRIKNKRLFTKKRVDLSSVKPSESTDTKTHMPNSVIEGLISKGNAFVFMWNAGWLLFLNRKDIDVIHTHVASWNAGYAAWIGNLLKIPVVCKAANLPAFDDFRSQVPFSSTLNTWRIRCPYLALTQEMKEDLIKEGVPETSIKVLPNGVQLPREIAKVESSKQILFVGNFTQGVAHKSYDVLLQAWAVLAGEFRDWTLCLVGGGDVDAWEKYTEDLKCSSQVTFAGRLSNVSAKYLDSALFVLVSRIEGISNALLEAQSFGLPAVVSDIPGNRAVVMDGETGFRIPHGDVKQTADALKKLIEDPGLRSSMGSKARERINECFSLSRVVEDLLNIYNDLTVDGFSK